MKELISENNRLVKRKHRFLVNIYYVFMGIFLPALYHFSSEFLYFGLEYSPIYNMKSSQIFIEEHPLFLDAIFCLIMIIVTLPLFMKVIKDRKKNGKYESRQKFKSKDIIPMILIAFGCGGVSLLWLIFTDSCLSNFQFIVDSTKEFEAAFNTPNTYSSYFWSFLSVVLLGPIIEEIIFRGVSFEYFSKIRDGWFPIIMTGLIFGIWHIIFVQVVYTAFQGLILGYIYYKKNNIAFPLMIHFINNLTSELPPFMNQDFIYNSIDFIKCICILPAIYLLIKIHKGEDWLLFSRKNM